MFDRSRRGDRHPWHKSPWGTVSDLVQSLTMVIGSGEVKKIDSSSTLEEEARGQRGGWVAWHHRRSRASGDRDAVGPIRELSMTIDDFLVQMPNLAKQYEHIWGHWSFGTDIVVLKCLETSAEPQRGFRPYVAGDGPYWGNQNFKSTGVQEAKAAMRRIARYFPALERASKSVRGGRPRNVGVTMQYSIDASQAPLAIERLRASDFAKRNPGRIMEMKFLKGSEQSYLGPNSGYDAMLFNTFWFVDEAVKLSVFDLFEDAMMRLGGRPHWGKLHKRQEVEHLRSVYPEWDKFETVRTKLDPNQTFAPPHRVSRAKATLITSASGAVRNE